MSGHGGFEKVETDMSAVKIFVRYHNTIVPTAPMPPLEKSHGLPITPMPKLLRQELGLNAMCCCGGCRPDRHHVWWERDKYSKGQLKKLHSLPKYVTEIADCEHDALHLAQDEPEVIGESLCDAIVRQAHLEEQLALTRSRIRTRSDEELVPESPKRKVKTLDQLQEEQDRLSEKLGLCVRAVGDLLAPQYYVVENGGIVIYTCTRQLPGETEADQS